MNYTLFYQHPIFRALLLCLAVLGTSGVQAQLSRVANPGGIIRTGSTNKLPAKAACTNDAGDIIGFVNQGDIDPSRFQGVTAGNTLSYASTSPDQDTFFLCSGDGFLVNFDEGSEDLSGDGGPATQPGIGYAFYTCPPTVTGPTPNDIENNEPCIPNFGMAPYNGELAIAPPVDYYARNYDLEVFNDPTNSPSITFGRPLVFTLAPITADSFDTSVGIVRYETPDSFPVGTTNPQCVNVSIDQAFTVAYLRPIAVSNANQSPTTCAGTFVVSGGVSELRGTGEYTISITNTVTGQEADLEFPSSTYRSGDVVNYETPVPGQYDITISDGIGCDFPGLTVDQPGTCSTGPGTGALEVEVAKTDISCLDADDGTITVSASGGTPDYLITYERTNPPIPIETGSTTTTADGQEFVFTNLPEGAYTITVTDAAGDIAADNIEIVEPRVTVDVERIQEIQCVDDANGILRADIFDGANQITDYSNFTFVWSNGATTREISNLGPGPYTVTATDNSTGCETVGTETLRAPNRLLLNQSQETGDDATCSGVSDGTVNIPITGGTQDGDGTYNISWSDGVDTTGTTINRTDLLPGSYSVIVTDANGCQDSVSLTVAATKTLLLNADSTNISCFGEIDGSITVTAGFDATGATPDYPFEVSLLDAAGAELVAPQTVANQGSTPVTFEALAPGTYTVVLRDQDAAGCEEQQTITIVEPALLEITEVVPTDFGCPDEFGTATVNVTGGTMPYTYRFKNDSLPDPVDTLMTFDSLVVDTNFIGDLQPDTNYVVIVTDANGCIDSTTFEINSPPRAAIAPIATDSVSCPSSTDGQLSTNVTAPPGESVVSTYWIALNPDGSLGDTIATNNNSTPANLAVGFYLFEATITNDCKSQALGEVASPGLVTLDSFFLQSPVCRGDANGSIFVYPSGGTGPYRYDWSVDGVSTSSSAVTNLAAGSYSVTITDANNCTPVFDTTFVLEEPVGIVGEFSNLQPVSCPDSTTNDGSATFTPSFSNDSTGLFDFYWSNGDTILQQASSTVTTLTRGPISVTVTDGFCPQVFTDTIQSPEDILVSFATVDVSCNDESDGAITATVTGGTPGYNYEWVDRTETGPTLDGLTAGSYDLLVTDSRGCTPVPDTATAVVLQPDALVLSINETLTTPSVTCAGDSNGVVAVFLSSTNNNPLADSPYTWSANVTDRDDNEANNLFPGTYSVTVTDNRGCQDSLEYTIIEPQPITFSVDPIDEPACFGELTQVSIDTAFGGQGASFDDYTFTLNDDGFLLPASQAGSSFAGEILVSVFDPEGCRADQTITVDQPEEISIELEDRIIVDLGDTLVQLDPIVTPPDNYTYLWTPAEGLSSDSIRNPFLQVLRGETFVITATNPNGCSASEDILVEVDANRNVYLPNAFSPNRDGRNEDFRVYACQGVVGVPSVQIYNRWGGLVHEATDIPANCLDGTLLWDGTTPNGSADGREVGIGVYVYVVEVRFLDDVTLTYRGDITVVR